MFNIRHIIVVHTQILTFLFLTYQVDLHTFLSRDFMLVRYMLSLSICLSVTMRFMYLQ